MEQRSNFFVFLRMLAKSKAANLFLILAILCSALIIYGTQPVKGSSYTLVQSSWAGGLDGGSRPAHPGDQTGWNKYDSKDANVLAGADLRLALQNGSVVQTSDLDFNAGTLSNVSIANGDASLGTASINNAWSTLSLSRERHSLVWDTLYNRVLLFGGNSNEVWAFDTNTNTWKRLDPSGTPPSSRGFQSAAWDPVNNRMLVFGGTVGNDTNLYAYSSANNSWTTLAPSGTPPAARYGHSAVWDSANTRMLIFGGDDAVGGGEYNDLWSYNSAANSWTKLLPATSPGARRYHTAAWDSANNRMFIYAGSNDAGTSLTDIWQYSASSNAWTQLNPSASPVPNTRIGGSAAWDSVNNRMLVFGGNSDARLWSYSPTANTWTVSSVSGQGAMNRNYGAAIWDPVSNRMLLFGGDNVTAAKEMWAYTSSGVGSILTSNIPAGTTGSSGVWDSQNNKMLIFGGYKGGSVVNELWQYNPVNSAFTYLSPTTSLPPGRQRHSAIWDNVNNRMYIFGGISGTYKNDLWYYTPSNNAWTQVSPLGTPPVGRYDSVMAYDPGAQNIYIYGGANAGNLGDIWVYSIQSNIWTQLNPTGTPPSARRSSEGGLDVSSGKLYIYGGIPSNKELWVYDIIGNTWMQLSPSGIVPETGYEGVGYWDSANNRLVVTAGNNPGVGYAYTVRAYSPANNSWSLLSTNGAVYSGRNLSAYAYNPNTQSLYIFSGDSLPGDLYILKSSKVYYSSGTLTSSVMDLGQGSSVGNLSFTNSAPAGTTVRLELRSSATAGGINSATWYGPTGAGTYYTASGTAINPVHNSDRYFQYRLLLDTSNTAIAPVFSDITVNFTYYPASGSLTSSAFNSNDAANIFAKIAWSEVIPNGTDVQFQLRSASDNSGGPGTWSAFVGPDGTPGTYFTDPAGGETTPSILKDGIDDQWIQYKVILSTTNGTQTPIVSNITSTYVVNAAPVLANLTASQGSNGKLSIGFDLSDTDNSEVSISIAAGLGITLSGGIASGDSSLTVSDGSKLPSSGSIYIDNEEIAYGSKSGNVLNSLLRARNNSVLGSHSNGAAIFVKASSLTGDSGSAVSMGLAKSVLWDIALDIPGFELASGSIKVFANDGNQANQIGTATVSSVVVDTQAPATLNASSVKGVPTSAYAATVTWETTEASDSTVEYGTSLAYGLSSSDTNLVTSHSVNITGLSPLSTYYFKVKSVDSKNNILIDDNNGLGYTVTTPELSSVTRYPDPDTTAPIIGSINISNIGLSSATVSWTTDEDASTLIYYGPTESYGLIAGNADIFSKTHTVNLVNLSAGAKYNLQIVSLDKAGNRGSSPNQTFETQPADPNTNTEQQITDLKNLVSQLQARKTVLETQIVDLQTLLDSLAADDATRPAKEQQMADLKSEYESVVQQLSKAQSDLQALENISKDELQQQLDALKSQKSSQEKSIQELQAKLNKLSGPEFEEVKKQLEDIKLKFEETERRLKVMEKLDEENKTLKARVSELEEHLTYITNKILGLKEGEKLSPEALLKVVIKKFSDLVQVFKKNPTAQVDNSLENELAEANITLKDLSEVIPGPKLITKPAVEVDSNQATVTWSTDKAAISSVNYADAVFFADKAQYSSHVNGPSNAGTEHSIVLNNLIPSTVYHFQIVSSTESGSETKSSDLTFRTKELAPEISEVTVAKISDTSARIRWTTSTISSSIVTYAPLVAGFADEKQTKNAGNPELVKEHIVVLKDLIAGTLYDISVSSSDAFGNVITRKLGNYLTAEDIIAPEITEVRTITSVTEGKGGKVQVIVTWKTNEPATTQLAYVKGQVYQESSAEKTQIDNSLSVNHTAVVTNWEAGKIYNYKVMSKDQFGNFSESKNFVVKAPEAKQTIVDVILGNFANTFGWTKKLQK